MTLLAKKLLDYLRVATHRRAKLLDLEPLTTGVEHRLVPLFGFHQPLCYEELDDVLEGWPEAFAAHWKVEFVERSPGVAFPIEGLQRRRGSVDLEMGSCVLCRWFR
jgi:hypothetical protein